MVAIRTTLAGVGQQAKARHALRPRLAADFNVISNLSPSVFGFRVRRLQEEMRTEEIDLLYVGHSTDLEYLIGVSRPARSFGPARYFAHWAMGALITPSTGPIVLVPRMLAEFAVSVLHGETRIILETDDPFEAMRSTVSELVGSGGRRIGINIDAEVELALSLQRAFPRDEVVLASSVLARVRAVKEDEEILALCQVCELTEQVYEEALQRLSNFPTTSELSRWMSARIREVGSDESFRPGVLFIGRDGTSDVITDSGLLRFDFGVASGGYCTDFGRTVSLGVPPEEVLSAFDVVVGAQRTAAEKLRPGTRASEVDAVARALIAEAGFGDFFRHRVGHGIGMDVNEPPYLEVVDDTPLEVGMTFTVEPGIWIPDRLVVFQEDIYRVTEGGGERLNRSPLDLRIL